MFSLKKHMYSRTSKIKMYLHTMQTHTHNKEWYNVCTQSGLNELAHTRFQYIVKYLFNFNEIRMNLIKKSTSQYTISRIFLC